MGMSSRGIDGRFLHENAEPLEGEFVGRIVDETMWRGSAVVFTTFLKKGGLVHNAAILAEKGRIRAIYNKIHLFDAFGYKESSIFAPGDELAIANLGEFKVGLAVCFDLRFPELFRAMSYRGVNLFIVPAGWYKGRYKTRQWQALVAARAHENVSYLVGVDQSIPLFIGHSTVVSPLGRVIRELAGEQRSCTVRLNINEIRKARKLLPTIPLSKRELYIRFYEQV